MQNPKDNPFSTYWLKRADQRWSQVICRAGCCAYCGRRNNLADLSEPLLPENPAYIPRADDASSSRAEAVHGQRSRAKCAQGYGQIQWLGWPIGLGDDGFDIFLPEDEPYLIIGREIASTYNQEITAIDMDSYENDESQNEKIEAVVKRLNLDLEDAQIFLGGL